MKRLVFSLLLVMLPAVAGCPVPQEQETPAWQKLEVDPASGAAYWLYVPSTYRQDTPAPLIISCHGTRPWDIPEHHIKEWKMLGETHGCIVATPSLIGTDGLLGGGPVSGMLQCERIIMSVISQLGYRFNIDRANIMITGFSGGGFPTYWVGLRHPDVFSVIVARNCNFNEGNVEGWVPAGSSKVAIKVYYGSNDPFPITTQSRAAVRYLRSKSYYVETEVLGGYGHQRQPEVAMAFFLKHRRPARPTIPSAKRAVARGAGGR